MSQRSIVVVGAINMDIHATSHSTLVLSDSNPGKVTQSIGGVGRNIAENLMRLNIDTKLITAFGEDVFAAMMKTQTADIGLDISLSLTAPHSSSSVYICVNQPNGDVYVAVSDMDICGHLTPGFLRSKLPIINQADALVLESNLPEETLTFLADNCVIPIFADSVSTKKVRRLKHCLSKLTGLKINRHEAELLTGLSIEKKEDAVSIACALHALGIQYVFITFGSEGGFLSNGSQMEFFPSMVRKMVNTTGCGDASLAGLVYSYLNGEDCLTMLKNSMAMAGMCAASSGAASPAVSPEALSNYQKQF